VSFSLDVRTRLLAQIDSSVLNGAQIVYGQKYKYAATGEYITLTETGGTSPYRIHNTGAVPSYRRPGMQIGVRAATFDRAMDLAQASYSAVVLRDTDINGVRYVYIEPDQEPYPVGLDANGRERVAFNIRAMKKPS